MKTVYEIYQEMLESFTLETGMNLKESSEMAVRLYTLAAQVYGLYVQNAWTLEQCFPQTAQGTYLEYHATLRGLSRNGATRAQGTLRFTVSEAQSEALAIAAGTVCMTAGLVRFETKQAGVIPAGALSVDIPAQAVEVGTSGNVAEGMVRTMSVAPLGVTACTNPTAFAGGLGAEEDESLRERVLETYRRMPNGANAAYYEREALSFEEVVAVNVLGKYRGIGTVDVVVAGPGGDPGVAVLSRLKAHLDEQREIAVDLVVRAPKVVNLSLRVRLAVKEGEDFNEVKSRVEQSFYDYFDGRQLGKSVLRAQIGELVYHVAGVENYSIVTPAQDLAIEPGELPKLTGLMVEVLP